MYRQSFRSLWHSNGADLQRGAWLALFPSFKPLIPSEWAFVFPSDLLEVGMRRVQQNIPSLRNGRGRHAEPNLLTASYPFGPQGLQ